ncbi:hypothetical protein AMR42_15120 [Limnothrix sp. PR1529]|uniref:hypothetical protein n=1 Tax=Limnothrix sp. PR1529 TaxID=1704291 RepID=UPI000C15176F|nr:hypothetical protein [Limnothrix sp. PR1529]PIB06283.1 hypothetical protein AMR42_15120 [Limnothrix sp. PR1529]
MKLMMITVHCKEFWETSIVHLQSEKSEGSCRILFSKKVRQIEEDFLKAEVSAGLYQVRGSVYDTQRGLLKLKLEDKFRIPHRAEHWLSIAAAGLLAAIFIIVVLGIGWFILTTWLIYPVVFLIVIFWIIQKYG